MIEGKSYRKFFLTILSGNVVSQMIPFLIIPFITRIFTKEEIATSANWLSMASLIGILATGRLDVAIPLPKSQREARFVFSSGFIIMLAVTLLSCVTIFFSHEIAVWYKDPMLESLVWLLPFGVASAGLVGITSNWALRNRQYKTVTSGKVVQALVNNLGAVVLGYLSFGTNGLIIAWVVSQFVNVFMLLERKEKQKQTKLWVSTIDFIFFNKIIRKYKEFPLVNSFHAFLDIFSTQFLLFYFISVYFSKEELALYYLMFRYVRAPINIVSSSAYQLYYVEINKLINNREPALPMAVKTIKTASIFAIPFVFVLVFFAPMVFEIYLGTTWREAGVYAQIFAPLFFLSFFSSPLSGTPLIFGKQKQALLFSVLAYSFSLGAIVLGHVLDWEFSKTLMLYSAILSTVYLLLIVWYLSLLKRFDERQKND